MNVESGDPVAHWVVLRLPWLGNASNSLRKDINAVVARGFTQVRLRVIFSTKHAFGGRAKDALPTSSRSSVILFTSIPVAVDSCTSGRRHTACLRG